MGRSQRLLMNLFPPYASSVGRHVKYIPCVHIYARVCVHAHIRCVSVHVFDLFSHLGRAVYIPCNT